MRIPRWLILPVIVVTILYWSQDIWQEKGTPSVFDVPKTLEAETYTLEVYHVSNINDVDVWTTSAGVDHDDNLYLTPAEDLPVDYKEKLDSGYAARVTGQYYKGKGIPEEYLYTTPKPERLKVFVFETIEMVLPSIKF